VVLARISSMNRLVFDMKDRIEFDTRNSDMAVLEAISSPFQ